MGIAGSPLVSHLRSSVSNLKLVSATSLPASAPSVPKSDHPASKKNGLATSAQLSDEALVQISMLKARDAQVRQHERAHLSASAGLDVSNASFTYQKGPNGIYYAVAGEVKIDTSPGRTPEEMLARAYLIMDAALAPVDPSAVDRSVAVKARQMAQQARVEMMQQENKVAATPSDHHANINHVYEDTAPARKNIDTFA